MKISHRQAKSKQFFSKLLLPLTFVDAAYLQFELTSVKKD
jgi:hypothetical protein